MMTIEEEIEHFMAFLSHPAGFDVDMFGLLCIRPIDECCPPQSWEVDWEDLVDGVHVSLHRSFNDLREAVTFYVERRHLMCLGIDFEALLMKEDEE
jgi:hypothetical protein